ncbi:TPA: hypothetical protein N2D26_005265 [Pseudomonas aeruginosa]|uniref:hypothetical protein n=1 Tax=Pseudomonas aeruginosa TaxID=287 RepID=UPI000998CD56|nr:hypothetical protein [Pseudomonas aeruginosa]OPA56618.1 hypothetical protein BZY59_31240 [Pseudomonas aeruginosa]HBP1144849.1 hypothetical protein [Pseudomonas aeruginosa]HCF1479551.1 hypothetical protein [Pseudomonas aeruginosa]HCL4356515.1 hypothetical protein [Pseudomonas aeruginosa]HEK1753065.1 hypothetical protein [Pseudomonas aeruginosa]
MSIDWSTAPEGATHWEPRSDKYREAWMKSAADKWFFWGSRRKAWIEESGISAEREATFEPRPQDAWDGKGLPPVGISVEWLSSAHGWLGGRVVGHDGSVAVVSHNDGYTGCHPHEVRPMPTPEQIAAEQREKAINQMISDAGYVDPKIGTFVAMRNLYDAGYRRQEEGK